MPKAKAVPCPRCGDSHVPPEPRCVRYNGWANYETWAVYLWLSNDEASYHRWRADAALLWQSMAVPASRPSRSDTRKQASQSALATRLKHAIDDNRPNPPRASLYTDLLGAALSEVDWYEVAGHFLPDDAS